MMRTIQWLLFVGLLSIFSIGFAQEEQEPLEEPKPLSLLPIGVTCGPEHIIMRPILDAGEVFVAKNITKFKSMDNTDLAAHGQIWINPQTLSFSYLFTFPDNDTVCYTFGGEEFQPANTEDKIKTSGSVNF